MGKETKAIENIIVKRELRLPPTLFFLDLPRCALINRYMNSVSLALMQEGSYVKTLTYWTNHASTLYYQYGCMQMLDCEESSKYKYYFQMVKFARFNSTMFFTISPRTILMLARGPLYNSILLLPVKIQLEK